MRLLPAVAAAGVAVALAVAACGGGGDGDRERVTVLAAASLTEVLPAVEPDAAYSFDGSDFLASQVREDVPADVYLAANARYPIELADDGLLEEVRVVARNRLVIVVQEGNPSDIRTVGDLAASELRVVIAGATVPVGEYTRAALATLDAINVLDNVASNENDVKAVVGKVALGEADAGIAYATDVAPVRESVELVELPDVAQPEIEYLAGVIASSERKDGARAFLELLGSERGLEALAAAGFDLP
jgi:molybdate transport system substrate-binding protein